MSRATREQAYSALFALLQTLPSLVNCSRRLKSVQDLQPGQFPAAYQLQEKQSATYKGSVPTNTTLRASWLLYVQNSDDTQPLTPQLNALVDAALAALAAPSPLQRNTLGGLVEYAAVSGDIEIFEGVLGDRAIAVLPIEIVLAGF